MQDFEKLGAFYHGQLVDEGTTKVSATLCLADAWRERVAATATGVLTLVGVEGDPMQSREHILLGAILEQAWRATA